MPGCLRFVLIPVVLLRAASATLAAQDPSITIEGASPDRTGPLRALLGSLPDRSDSTITITTRLWYADAGFLRARSETIVQHGGGDIVVRVSEGRPSRIERVIVEGLPAGEWPIELLSLEGGPFSPAAVERAIDAALRRETDAGRHGSHARIVSVREREAPELYEATITFAFVRAGQSVVRGVGFSGLTHTTVPTARELSGVRTGERWSSLRGESGRRRLHRTRLFSGVSVAVAGTDSPDSVDVWFTVVERKHNAFDGMVGYLPGTGSEGGTLTGLVHVRFGNLFGTARRAEIRWFQERRSRNEVGLRYREPMLGGYPAAAEGSFLQRRQDSTYVRTDVEAVVDAEIGDDMTAGVSVTTSSTVPSEGYGRSVLSGGSALTAGVRFSYDSREQAGPSSPGAAFSTELRAGRKQSTAGGVPSSSSMQSLRFDAELVVTVGRRQAVSGRMHGRDVRSARLDVSDAFRLGGTATLRGYREGELIGSRAVWGSVEYRLFVASDAFVGAFVDAGSVSASGLPGGGTATFALGYGATTLVSTPVGSVSLSIALGRHDAVGDAKLHLRLATEF